MSVIPKNDRRFFAEIAELLSDARSAAKKAVNSVMVSTYWQIGRRIVEQEQKGKPRANYSDYLITNLSRYLGESFGKGFSEANLLNMRQFYLVFPDYPQFPRHCLGNLSWSNINLIMRLDDRKERKYYLKESSEQNWSFRQLKRNIKTGYYRRQIPVKSARKGQKNITLSVITDPMVLEFLGLPEDTSGKETALEKAIIDNLQKFIMELGKGFSFVDRQMRVSSETSDFYIDLVFYNYILKCFVIVDLKTGKLTHQDIGQMDMYVRMFDALKRLEGDNPTVGIILCAEKDEIIAKYSVLSEGKRLFAAKYKTILPTEQELSAYLVEKNHAL
jgi:predicted nuclease of restriction endonuclease-like (RecB) superfamily